MKKSEILIFNGKKVDDLEYEDLKRGFLYGDGIFETLISRNFKIFRFEQHWERLEKGANICDFEMPYKERLKKLVEDILIKYRLKNSYIRINLWRKKPQTFSPQKNRKTNSLVIIRKLKNYPIKFYREGMRCIISKRIRKNEKSLISQIKSFNYLENIILKIEAEKENFDDAIVLNNSGYICEGSVSNIFFVKSYKIYTPSIECGCLDGITRRILFEICKENGIEIKEGFFKLDFLKECEEVFLTNTLMEIMPVVEIKDYFRTKGFKFTKNLIEKYEQILKKETL